MNENIFTNLYNKVLGFFRQTDKEENAKDIACNRLRVVLMQDRTNLTPELMERMRKELIELLSKYVEMDKEALELNLEQDGDQMALMLSIPVLRARNEEEIEAELAKEDAEKEEVQEASDDADTEHADEETGDKDTVAVTEEEDEAVPEDDKSADVKVTAKEENLSPDDTEKSKK